MADNNPWWKETTIYQIYPRSFKDSNGDGIGDLQGIIDKLDYIQQLGFETIWISPFFASPQQDWGYDVSGYREIAPEYGTLPDAEQLIHEVHDRGMKLIFDLVLNHTSIHHPWFIQSSSSRDNPKCNWYIWRDGRGKNQPPNNWKAIPGGSGWHYHPARDQWYYASFLPFQPDLNWRNPEVKDEMFRVTQFWLDKGVDGYRLDIFHAIYKADHFLDNPFHLTLVPKDDKYGYFTEWKYTISQPETIELAHELRQLLDHYSPVRFMVGEIFGEPSIIKKYLGEKGEGMHTIFQWDLMDFTFKPDFFWDTLYSFETSFPEPYTPVLVLGNHDSRRWIDRVGDDLRKAKLITLLQLTARGLPVVYYGEEIGLQEGRIPAKESLDPVGQRYAWVPAWLLDLLNLYINRDNCRTPMAWDPSQLAGFSDSDAKPWLPLSADPSAINVKDQIEDPDSLLNWYRILLKLRETTPALRAGSLKLLSRKLTQKGLLGYIRQCERDKYGILINMDVNPVNVELAGTQIQAQTGQISLTPDKILVGGYSGCVVKLVDKEASA